MTNGYRAPYAGARLFCAAIPASTSLDDAAGIACVRLLGLPTQLGAIIPRIAPDTHSNSCGVSSAGEVVDGGIVGHEVADGGIVGHEVADGGIVGLGTPPGSTAPKGAAITRGYETFCYRQLRAFSAASAT